MESSKMDLLPLRNVEEPSGSVKTRHGVEYENTSGDDDDSEATLSANEEMEDDIAENEKYSDLSAEYLFRLIMSDHQYLSNTFPKCFGHTAECDGDGDHGGTESPIPDAAAIQHFFLKAMNLASFEPIKDEELKLKYPSKCPLKIPFDKLTNPRGSGCHQQSNDDKKHNSETKPERNHEQCSTANVTQSKSKEDFNTSASSSRASANQVEGMGSRVKDADNKIAQCQWTSECKAVFERVQHASYSRCALKLLQRMWENYLGSSFEKIRRQEIQRASMVDFCDDVRQMIEDDDRYVCQVIEEMEPTAFTTDFVIR